jgi:hypothetical protein
MERDMNAQETRYDLTTLRDLKERVGKATGPDRELDGALEVQVRRFEAYAAGLNDETRAKWKHNVGTVFDGNTGYSAALHSASIDASLALVERVLPGWVWHVGGCQSDFLSETCMPFWAELSGPVSYKVVEAGIGAEPTFDVSSAPGQTAPLAIVSSALSALIAKEEARMKEGAET